MGSKFFAAFLMLLLFLTDSLLALKKVYVSNPSLNIVNAIDIKFDTIVATIPVAGSQPESIVSNSGQTRVYVVSADATSDTIVSVIDVFSDTVIATIDVYGGLIHQFAPQALVISPDGTRLYVIGSDNQVGAPGFVKVIDTSINEIIATVSVSSGAGADGADGVITPDGTQLYAVGSNSLLPQDTVSVLDTATNTVIATVTVGQFSSSSAITPDGSKVFVTSEFSTTVYVIDTRSNLVIASIPTDLGPNTVRILPNGTQAYVLNVSASDANVIDTSTFEILATVHTGPNAQGVAFSNDSSEAFVGNDFGVHNVTVIDTRTFQVITTVTVGSSVIAISAVPPRGAVNKIYVSATPYLSAINTISDAITATITDTGFVFDFAYALGPGRPTHQAAKSEKDRFLMQADLINVISWGPPTETGTDVVIYRIYRNAALTDLAASVLPTDKLQFKDHNRQKNVSYTYYIVSEDIEQDQSLPVTVTITPR